MPGFTATATAPAAAPRTTLVRGARQFVRATPVAKPAARTSAPAARLEVPAAAAAPAASAVAAVAPAAWMPSSRRPIEKPPAHGEKPFAQLVTEAFDGPVLRLSRKIKLLEEADNRDIRRGDALDLIAHAQRRLEKKHRVRPWHPAELFATQYAAFAAAYVTLAVAWCAVMALQ